VVGRIRQQVPVGLVDLDASRQDYGYDATNDRLLVSGDRGRSWDELEKPGPLIDLAVDPGNGRRTNCSRRSTSWLFGVIRVERQHSVSPANRGDPAA
jgi:hypothetical protein